MNELYPDFSDDEIIKANTEVAVIIFDPETGEILQQGYTDQLAAEAQQPETGKSKLIINEIDRWMLRGEFVDHEDTKKPMFKIEDGELVAKEAHVEKITDMRMPRDGAKKKPIEVDGIGGKEIIGFETVQEPIRVEKAKEIKDIKRK